MKTTLPPARFSPSTVLFGENDSINIEEKHRSFHKSYLFGTDDQKASVIKEIEKWNEFDPNYEEELFFVLAARKGDKEFLELLFRKIEHKNIDPNDLADILFETLSVAALDGHTKCVEFLIDEKGADPESLIGYTAYSNYPHIRELLDQKIAAKKNSVIQAGNGTLVNKLASLSISPASEKATSSIEASSSQAESSSIASLPSFQKIEEISQANALNSIEKKIQEQELEKIQRLKSIGIRSVTTSKQRKNRKDATTKINANKSSYIPCATIEELLKNGEDATTKIAANIKELIAFRPHFSDRMDFISLLKHPLYAENPEIQYRLGKLHLTKPISTITEKEKEEGIQALKAAAAQGYAKAQQYLGQIYDDGQILPQDLDEAYKYYQLAAEQGSTQSQRFLGQLYYEGRAGVAQDLSLARHYFEKVAISDKRFHYIVAVLYHYEAYTNPEVYQSAIAIRHYLEAVNQGFRISSAIGLILCYLETAEWEEATLWLNYFLGKTDKSNTAIIQEIETISQIETTHHLDNQTIENLCNHINKAITKDMDLSRVNAMPLTASASDKPFLLIHSTAIKEHLKEHLNQYRTYREAQKVEKKQQQDGQEQELSPENRAIAVKLFGEASKAESATETDYSTLKLQDFLHLFNDPKLRDYVDIFPGPDGPDKTFRIRRRVNGGYGTIISLPNIPLKALTYIQSILTDRNVS